MKKFLLISHDNTRTGAPLALLRLAQELAPVLSDTKVALGFPGPGPLPGKEAGQVEHFHYRLRSFPTRLRITDPGARLVFIRLLKKHQPKLVLANTLEAFQAVVAAADLNIPSLWLIHEFLSGYTHRREFSLMKKAAQRAQRLVFNSQASWAELGILGKNLSEKSSVVRPGVSSLTSCAQPFSQGSRVVAISIGDICPPKRQKELLFELAPVFKKYPEFILRLVGRTPRKFRGYARELKEQIVVQNLKGRVQLVGELSNPISELLAADLFVHAAKRESLGLGILEAMAAGLPVAATISGGALEIIRDGQDGLVADPGKLGEAVEKIISSPSLALELGINARKRARNSFSLPGYAGAIMNLIKNMQS